MGMTWTRVEKVCSNRNGLLGAIVEVKEIFVLLSIIHWKIINTNLTVQAL
jgi:hypothetical protein